MRANDMTTDIIADISQDFFSDWEATEAYLASCASGFPLS